MRGAAPSIFKNGLVKALMTEKYEYAFSLFVYLLITLQKFSS